MACRHRPHMTTTFLFLQGLESLDARSLAHYVKWLFLQGSRTELSTYKNAMYETG